jgi:protein O-GlcNAc transferase
LTNGYVTFGSFNNSNKIDERTIALWADILRALPSSRLLMAAVPQGERQQWITQQFEQVGVARDRIDFHGRLPSHEFHILLGQADIALDPLLVTGGTTTCESLWMGVPVIVLTGQRFIHRVGYSFLCSAGLPQYAAATLEDYVRIALEAAADLSDLAQLRADMRNRLSSSPLMDAQRFTKHLEQTYRGMWQTWCEKRATEDLHRSS